MDFEIKVGFVHRSNALDAVKLPWNKTIAIAGGTFSGDEVEGEDGEIHPIEVVSDHLKLLDEVEAMSEQKVFREDLIGHLHRGLMGNILLSAGEFREFDLPGGVPAKQLPLHVRKFTEYLNKMHRRAKNPASFAWTMHHELARIKPFVKANGRVCRLVYVLLRLKAGLMLDIDSFSDRDSYLERINGYFRAKAMRSQSEGEEA